MKKTLITFIMIILMSAGIFFSASSVKADVLPLSYSVGRNDSKGTFTSDYYNLERAHIEYTYYSNDILMSEIADVKLNYESQDSQTLLYIYTFTLPENTLSFMIWRVITEDDMIKSLTGDFEYIYSQETSVSAVETRIKKLYIDEDLITKELAPMSYGGILSYSYIFNMHFNVNDVSGTKIPIDRIHSLNVEYDVISTTLFLFETVNHYEKTIVATETRNMTIWPFITPESVKTYIKESIDPNYDWMVELASIADPDAGLPLKDITLDQTTILTISYYYNDVFYEDIEVVDEPYEWQDIIEVIPGTTIALPGWLDLLENIDQFAGWIKTLIYIGFGIMVILIAMIILRIITFIGYVFKLLKWIFFALSKVLKFILITIPKGVMNFIIFMLVPKERRRERRYRDVSRYL